MVSCSCNSSSSNSSRSKLQSWHCSVTAVAGPAGRKHAISENLLQDKHSVYLAAGSVDLAFTLCWLTCRHVCCAISCASQLRPMFAAVSF
jgi:hypothetical protein